MDSEEREKRKQRLKELVQQKEKKRLEELYTSVALEFKEYYRDINLVEILSEEESKIIYDKLQDDYLLYHMVLVVLIGD